MRCKNYAQARISAVCRPLMSLLGVHAVLVINALTHSLESKALSRAVRIFHCGCISVYLLDSNRCSLFEFCQITGVGNSNPAFELLKFSNQTLHPYRLFTLVVTADCACPELIHSLFAPGSELALERKGSVPSKLMVWKLLQLQILYPLPAPSLWWCAKTETEKPNQVLEIDNRIKPNLKNLNWPSPIGFCQEFYGIRQNKSHFTWMHLSPQIEVNNVQSHACVELDSDEMDGVDWIWYAVCCVTFCRQSDHRGMCCMHSWDRHWNWWRFSVSSSEAMAAEIPGAAAIHWECRRHMWQQKFEKYHKSKFFVQNWCMMSCYGRPM